MTRLALFALMCAFARASDAPPFALERVVTGELSGGKNPEVRAGRVSVLFDRADKTGGAFRLFQTCYDRDRGHKGPHTIPYRVSWTLAGAPEKPTDLLAPTERVTLDARLEIEPGAPACAHAESSGPLVWVFASGNQVSQLMAARKDAPTIGAPFATVTRERLSLAEKTTASTTVFELERGATRAGYFGVSAHLGFPGVTAEAMYLYRPVVMKSPTVNPTQNRTSP